MVAFEAIDVFPDQNNIRVCVVSEAAIRDRDRT
jgi:hypothetical protein